MPVREDALVPLPSRAVAAIVLGGCAVVTAMLAGLSIADPFHLRHARWFSLGLVFVTIVLLTIAFAVAVRGLLRWFVVVLGVLAVVGWAGLAIVAVGFIRSNDEIRSVADGGRRLVVLQRTPLSDDVVYAVVLRSGGGPFEQESVVYQGLQGSRPPADLRFVNADTVEVVTGDGCDYRSAVQAVTLDVDPVHMPLQVGSC